jgi:integrase/recombinase XerD
VNAVIGMKVKDYFTQGRRGWVRLHEKGGKEHEVPCHHMLEKLLDEYLAAAGIVGDAEGPLFRTTGRKTAQAQAMWQQDVYRMIQRRAAAGIKTKPRSAITRSARPASPPTSRTRARSSTPRRSPTTLCTTKLYDRRTDEISLDEVEKISI